MPSLIETGLANAVCAAILALFVLAIGRIWRRPALLHGLWLLVLLKLVTPPLLPLPVRVLPAEAPAPIPVVATVQPAGYDPVTVGQFLSLPSKQDGELGLGVTLESASKQPDSFAATAPRAVADSAAPINWMRISHLVASTWLGGAVVWTVIAGIRMVRFH